jgi:ubiquinone/menaquinone biosynthesis C-methylase UbiE
MDPVIKQDNDRLKLFRKYGYDIPKARNYIIAKAGLLKGGSVLEVGTGRGHMATALARKGFKLISIDVDKKAQGVAKIHLKAIKGGKSVKLKIMNAEKLRYKDGYFDQVISVNFIHHAKNPFKCLKEMMRVANNKLIVADINKRGERIMERVHRLDGHDHALSKISLKEMEVLLKSAGMKVRAYRDTCQTVLVAKKGAQNENMYTDRK